MKRFGYFCLGFVPFLMVNFIQGIASVFTLSCGALACAINYSGNDLFSFITSLFMDNDFNVSLMLVYALICIIVFGLWYYIALGGEYRPDFGRRIRPLQIIAIVLLIPGLQGMADLITTGIYYTVPSWMDAYEQLMEDAGMDGEVTFYLFLYSVIFAPICEELIFRGCTIRLFERVIRHFWMVNILQAVLFGIFHGNWVQGCYAFALGLVLGFVCERGGSIYYSILLHMLFNFWGTVMSTWLEGIYNSGWADLFIIGSTLLSLGIGGYLFLLGLRNTSGVFVTAREGTN